MHHATKKSAVAKYKPLLAEGKSEAEVREAIAADDREFDKDSVNEIFEAILNDESEGDGSNNGDNSASDAKHKVVFQFRDKTDQKLYNPGDDVSHFTAGRIKELVGKGIIEKK